MIETTARGLPARAWRSVLLEAPAPPPLPPPGSTVTVVSAHPDDETLGAAGLLQRLAARALHLRLVVATDGEAGYPAATRSERALLAATRREELRAGLSVLGHAGVEPIHLGLPDGDVAGHEQRVTAELSDLLSGTALCLTLWEHDPHPHHRATARPTLAAVVGLRRAGRPAPPVWRCPIWMRHSTPVTDAPAGLRALRLGPDELAAKRAAIACHASQVRSPHPGHGPVLPRHVLDLFDDLEPFVVGARP